MGVGQPPGYPFNLNSAVDALLKKEFDGYREQVKPHPLMIAAGIDAVPYKHEKMDEWRDSLRKGIQFHHKHTNLVITGGVDDIWENKNGELIIVDYKATSKNGEVALDAEWQDGYRRQMSLYAWLFKQNGFKVAPKGYFVYCNGRTDADAFNARLDFKISVLPYEIDDSWVENTIVGAHECLKKSEIPPATGGCDFCSYVDAVSSLIDKS